MRSKYAWMAVLTAIAATVFVNVEVTRDTAIFWVVWSLWWLSAMYREAVR